MSQTGKNSNKGTFEGFPVKTSIFTGIERTLFLTRKTNYASLENIHIFYLCC